MAEMIKIYEKNPNSNDIKKVVSVLRKGGLIIYPSDTVYALGCDISNYKALEKLARIKEVKLEKANFSFVCDSISNISDSMLKAFKSEKHQYFFFLSLKNQ